MSAVLSDDGRYRFELRRRASLDGEGTVCWVMLNPSTADAEQDDPTIRRCLGFTRDWGYADLVVVNLWPLRATKPDELLEWFRSGQVEVAHRKNLDHLGAAVAEADLVVAAWGVWPAKHDLVMGSKLLWAAHGRTIHALGFTKDGSPKHPLYVRKDARLQIWREAVKPS